MLLPILLMVSLTASFRIASSASVGQLLQSGMLDRDVEKYNSTEDTLLQYEIAKRLLVQQRDKEALAQLQSLQFRPVHISEAKCHDPRLENIHPKSLVLGMAIQMMQRVEDLKRDGDTKTARKYIGTMYNLSRCLLKSNAPTAEERELAQHIRKLAKKSERNRAHHQAMHGRIERPIASNESVIFCRAR